MDKYIYKEVDGVSLPIAAFGAECSRKKPAVICIHGGAWKTSCGIDWNGDYIGAVSDEISKGRWITVSVEYRSIDNCSLHTIVEDCIDAYNYIIENAELMNIDTDKIILFGDSAGGHLTLVLSSSELENLKKKPVLTVACNPITDIRSGRWADESKTEQSERKALSPVCNIKNGMPFIYLMHGSQDVVVDCGESRQLYNIMSENGVKCELDIINGAGHAFILKGYYKDKAVTEEAVKMLEKKIVEFIV